MRDADAASDHELVRCKLRVKLKNNEKMEVARRKNDVAKLHKSDQRTAFCLELKNIFDDTTGSSTSGDEVERIWEHLDNTHNNIAEVKLGYKKRGQKQWIGKESWKIVEEGKGIEMIENCKLDRLRNRMRVEYTEDREEKSSRKRTRRKLTDSLIEDAERTASNERMKTVYGH